MSLKKIAQELNLLGPDPGGQDVPEKELESRVLERFKELQQTKTPPSATRFFDKPDLADCQIRVMIASSDDFCGGTDDEGWADGGANRKPTAGGKRGAVTRSKRAQPAAKRAKSSTSTGDVRVIQVHAIILAQRSPYFETALTGGWREREDKAIDIALPSVEAFEDFRLLLKLSYGGTFVMDDGDRVPRDVMLRLLLMSNRFEMVGAFTELAGALKEGMTYEEAVDVFRNVPEEIRGHDAIKSLLNHGGDTIAEGLGPVHELWGTGPCEDGLTDFDTDFPLAAKAEALPLHALERALRSSKLQIRSENEAFTLMESWLLAQQSVTGEVEQDAWDRLSRSMRFRRMSCDFLNSVVARSYWFTESSRKAHIFGTCLWHLQLPPTWRTYQDRLGAPDRGSANPRQWTLRAHFLRADVNKLEEGSDIVRGIGVANGYGVMFGIQRHGPGARFYFGMHTRPLESGESSHEDDDGGQLSGVLVARAVRVEDLHSVRGWRVLSADRKYAISGMDISSWEAFVAEDGPYFRAGKCRVKATLRFWNGVPGHENGDWYESDGEL